MSIAYSTYAHMLGFGAGVFVLLLLLLGIFKIFMYFTIRKMENETFGRISESIDRTIILITKKPVKAFVKSSIGRRRESDHPWMRYHLLEILYGTLWNTQWVLQ